MDGGFRAARAVLRKLLGEHIGELDPRAFAKDAKTRLQEFLQARRIPLAWLLLTRQPVRLAVALAGISFAGILMFMQLGFRDEFENLLARVFRRSGNRIHGRHRDCAGAQHGSGHAGLRRHRRHPFRRPV